MPCSSSLIFCAKSSSDVLVCQWSVFRLSCAHIFKKNISKVSRPIVINFHIRYHQVVGKAAKFVFANWIAALVDDMGI